MLCPPTKDNDVRPKMAGEDDNYDAGGDGDIVICDGMDAGVIAVAPTSLLALFLGPANTEDTTS